MMVLDDVVIEIIWLLEILINPLDEIRFDSSSVLIQCYAFYPEKTRILRQRVRTL